MALRERLPWWAKIAAKLLLSRLPFGYSIWRRLSVFSHGDMSSSRYALDVFMDHWERAGRPDLRNRAGFLELGPGDSLASGVIAGAMGARVAYLVDVGKFADRRLQTYQRLLERLEIEGFRVPELRAGSSLDDLQRRFRVQYLTNGLQSLRKLPNDCVDFAFSHATLEHIRRHEFLPTMKELRRIVRPDGSISHRVDLRDHLGGGLSHLRFRDRTWESRFMASSGFYTNRIGFAEMCRLMERAGFRVQVINVDRWRRLPTARKRLAAPFRARDDVDLLVSGFDVILT